MRSAFSNVAHSLRVSLDAFGNPQLRRVELAFVGFTAAEWGTWIAILVFAYEAGAIGVVQLVPAALFAPFASVLGDRYRRERVLFAFLPVIFLLLSRRLAGIDAAGIVPRDRLALLGSLMTSRRSPRRL